MDTINLETLKSLMCTAKINICFKLLKTTWIAWRRY